MPMHWSLPSRAGTSLLRVSEAATISDEVFIICASYSRSEAAKYAQIRRTREVIERVEVEHVAEAGELPVVTTAEQRVIKATEMERGKHLSDEALPQVSGTCRMQLPQTARRLRRQQDLGCFWRMSALDFRFSTSQWPF